MWHCHAYTGSVKANWLGELDFGKCWKLVSSKLGRGAQRGPSCSKGTLHSSPGEHSYAEILRACKYDQGHWNVVCWWSSLKSVIYVLFAATTTPQTKTSPVKHPSPSQSSAKDPAGQTEQHRKGGEEIPVPRGDITASSSSPRRAGPCPGRKRQMRGGEGTVHPASPLLSSAPFTKSHKSNTQLASASGFSAPDTHTHTNHTTHTHAKHGSTVSVWWSKKDPKGY